MEKQEKLILQKEGDIVTGKFMYYIMQGDKCHTCLSDVAEEAAIRKYNEILANLREMKLGVEIIKEEII